MYDPNSYNNDNNNNQYGAQPNGYNAQQWQNPYQPTGWPTQPKKKKTHWLVKVIIAALIIGVIGGSCVGGAYLLFKGFRGASDSETLSEPLQIPDRQTPDTKSGSDSIVIGGSDSSAATQSIPYTTVLTGQSSGTAVLDVTEVVKNTMPSMVAINVVVTKTYSDPYGFGIYFGYGGGYQYEVSGSGSGIIIGQNDTELLIVTNNHVVGDAKEIAIEFIDGETASAYLKGTNADYDLAVVGVKLSDLQSSTLSSIKIAVMGSSDELVLGEPAIAIGNALGYGQSVTVGYISALQREVTFTDGKMTLIQTDAAINPGNSGGALLNLKGEVVGINSAKYSDTDVEGMGYAIPISDAIPIINELMNSVTVPESEKPYLGIVGQTLPESYRSYFKWPEGVYVSEITSGSPAALAGLKAGDIITGFNGKTITTMEELQAAIEACKVGDSVTVTVARPSRASDGSYPTEELTLRAVLIARSSAKD